MTASCQKVLAIKGNKPRIATQLIDFSRYNELGSSTPRRGSCLLVSGKWASNTRYEMALNFTFPVPNNSNGASKLQVTMTPITYQSTGFSSRGHKYEQICSERLGYV
jgi:hypothetical protein